MPRMLFLIVALAAAPGARAETGLLDLVRAKLRGAVASKHLAGTTIFDDTAARQILGLKRASLDKLFAAARATAVREGDPDPRERMAIEVTTLLLDHILRGTSTKAMHRQPFYETYVVADPPRLRARLRAKIWSRLDIDSETLRDPDQVEVLNERARELRATAEGVAQLPDSPLVREIAWTLGHVADEITRPAGERPPSAAGQAHPGPGTSSVAGAGVDDDENAAAILGLAPDAWRERLAAARDDGPGGRDEVGAVIARALTRRVLADAHFQTPARRHHFYDQVAIESPEMIAAAIAGEAREALGLGSEPLTLPQFNLLTLGLERLKFFGRSAVQRSVDRTLTELLLEVSPYSFAAPPGAEPSSKRPGLLWQKINGERASFHQESDRLFVARVRALEDSTLVAYLGQMAAADRIQMPPAPRRPFAWFRKPKLDASAARAALNRLDVGEIIDAEWARPDGATSERTRRRLDELRAELAKLVDAACDRELAAVAPVKALAGPVKTSRSRVR